MVPDTRSGASAMRRWSVSTACVAVLRATTNLSSDAARQGPDSRPASTQPAARALRSHVRVSIRHSKQVPLAPHGVLVSNKAVCLQPWSVLQIEHHMPLPDARPSNTQWTQLHQPRTSPVVGLQLRLAALTLPSLTFLAVNTALSLETRCLPAPDDGEHGHRRIRGDGQHRAGSRDRRRGRDDGPRSTRPVGVQQVRRREDLPVKVAGAVAADRAAAAVSTRKYCWQSVAARVSARESLSWRHPGLDSLARNIGQLQDQVVGAES